MGAASRLLVLAILGATSLAPGASASDPFYEEVCVINEGCVGAGTCVDAVAAAACVPRGCSVVVSCRSEIGPDSTECAFNMTIDGQTCAVHVMFLLDGGDNNFGATAQVSNGSVSSSPLDNTWVSPGVEASLRILGVDLGGLHATAYRSDIQTEGPRGGLFGMLAPGAEHTWTEIGVTAGHTGGPGFGEDAVVALELMDFMPEGCWVRSPSGAFPEVECPRFGPFYSLIPLA